LAANASGHIQLARAFALSIWSGGGVGTSGGSDPIWAVVSVGSRDPAEIVEAYGGAKGSFRPAPAAPPERPPAAAKRRQPSGPAALPPELAGGSRKQLLRPD
jgi:hypothetical protein